MASFIISTNPAHNYDVLGEVPMSSIADVQAALRAARAAFPAWKALPLADRLSYVVQLRDQFLLRKQDFAELMTREMGMPITQSLYTVDRAVGYITWSLDHAAECLAPEVTFENDTEINEIVFEPYGVAACISPWNFPASNFVWACIQALIAGNTVIFKNSEETQLCAVLIADMIQKSAFPEGVFQVIYGDGTVAQELIAGDINLISFTGSSRVGELLYKQAAEKFIPAVLELGGSDPAIVFADADLKKAIPAIYGGRFTNCGQVCVSLKRLIVHESRVAEVISHLQELLSRKIVGDPMNAATDIGPLVSARQRDLLMDQVQDAVDKGATILCGGHQPDDLNGAYYTPTLISGVTREMRIWHEEVFGPVLPIVTFTTYEDAIAKANDTIYGLGASIYTEDKDLAKRAIGDIQVGMVRVNHTTTSKPCNIFGGMKRSGIGRENSVYGFHDVTQKKMTAREK